MYVIILDRLGKII